MSGSASSRTLPTGTAARSSSKGSSRRPVRSGEGGPRIDRGTLNGRKCSPRVPLKREERQVKIVKDPTLQSVVHITADVAGPRAVMFCGVHGDEVSGIHA